MPTIFPYIFLIAYPDYKRPCTKIVHGSCEKNLLKKNITKILVDIITDICDVKLRDFYQLNEYIYSDGYMDQPPIEIMYFDTEKNTWLYYDFNEKEIINLYNQQIEK